MLRLSVEKLDGIRCEDRVSASLIPGPQLGPVR